MWTIVPYADRVLKLLFTVYARNASSLEADFQTSDPVERALSRAPIGSLKIIDPRTSFLEELSRDSGLTNSQLRKTRGPLGMMRVERQDVF